MIDIENEIIKLMNDHKFKPTKKNDLLKKELIKLAKQENASIEKIKKWIDHHINLNPTDIKKIKIKEKKDDLYN